MHNDQLPAVLVLEPLTFSLSCDIHDFMQSSDAEKSSSYLTVPDMEIAIQMSKFSMSITHWQYLYFETVVQHRLRWLRRPNGGLGMPTTGAEMSDAMPSISSTASSPSEENADPVSSTAAERPAADLLRWISFVNIDDVTIDLLSSHQAFSVAPGSAERESLTLARITMHDVFITLFLGHVFFFFFFRLVLYYLYLFYISDARRYGRPWYISRHESHDDGNAGAVAATSEVSFLPYYFAQYSHNHGYT